MTTRHKSHQVLLKNLRADEQVLHNCSSHPLIHLKQPFFYLFALALPFWVLWFLNRGETFGEAAVQIWFLYACYGLALTTFFFVKGVNFELGGCVITNQRLLRFGYRGLWGAVEREIFPNKIEDFKVEKKGLMSLFFNTAHIYIHTSNQQTDRLRWVVEPEKVQNAFATMVKLQSKTASAPGSSPEQTGDWLDVALKDSSDFNLDTHRQSMIHEIGDVFRGKRNK